MNQSLILGTAQWGWTVSREKAFLLLDEWLKSGYRRIDCATNYPLNKIPGDFRAAEHIVQEYIRAHGIDDLEVTMKIGSLDNMRSPESNLMPSFIQMMAGEYERILGKNLDCLMFHWDNRQDIDSIRQSIEILARLQEEAGIRPGLSGIKHPAMYREANALSGLNFDIQVKHNILQSDLDRYLPFFPPGSHHYFAYGINAGGIKIGELPYPSESTFLARGGTPESVAPKMARIAALLPEINNKQGRPPVMEMYQLGMINAGLNPGLSGIVLGVTSVTQLQATLQFWKMLSVHDFSDVWRMIQPV